MPEPGALLVNDDDRDFYGRHYFERMALELSLPTLRERARNDLPERCLHWLSYLLQYRPPGAKVLELGSGHGGFLGLMQWAGFDARGLELSPWLVNFAQQTFGVPMLVGPVESQMIAPRSLDAVVLMDLLEHLSDPAQTLHHCAGLLAPDGIFLLQTPCYREGKSYRQMVDDADPFLAMLRPEQHLFLFSATSVRRLLATIGFDSIEFLPAIFSQYDMFLCAGREALVQTSPDLVQERLTSSPSGRMIDALLQLRDQVGVASQRLAICESDRSARLAIIEEQGESLSQLEELRHHLEYVERDRAARLAIIEEQGECLSQLEELRHHLEYVERDRAARLTVIEEQAAKLAELEKFRQGFEYSEADRAARLAVIEEQAHRLSQLDSQRDALPRLIGHAVGELDAVRACLSEAIDLCDDVGLHLKNITSGLMRAIAGKESADALEALATLAQSIRRAERSISGAHSALGSTMSESDRGA